MSFGPLVDAGWLAEHLDDVRVVDVRWYLDGRSGRQAYEAGHLPGAVWLDIDTDLSDPPGPRTGRHPLPAPEAFAAALGRVGIAAGTPVVAYDDTGGSTAARLWWLLDAIDEPAAVLDGGLAAWTALPGPLRTDEARPRPVARPARAWPPDRFVTADQLAVDGEAVVYDARTAERYTGGLEGVDPRPGHIPGARNAPWAGNLDESGRFRAAGELRERYRAGIAAAAERPTVAYCGSGVTACHDLLAMRLAGLSRTALYPGSWSQWGADEARPAERSTPPAH